MVGQVPSPSPMFVVIYLRGGLVENVFIRNSQAEAIDKAQRLARHSMEENDEIVVERAVPEANEESQRVTSLSREEDEA